MSETKDLAESIAFDPYALTPDQWASEARQAIDLDAAAVPDKQVERYQLPLVANLCCRQTIRSSEAQVTEAGALVCRQCGTRLRYFVVTGWKSDGNAPDEQQVTPPKCDLCGSILAEGETGKDCCPSESVEDEQQGHTLIAAEQQTPTPSYKFGGLTPWTEGDARIAVEAKEPFGCTLLLQEIVDIDGNVVARVEYLPTGTDEENAVGPLVLDALNSHAELKARVQALESFVNYVRDFYQQHFDVMPVAFQSVDSEAESLLEAKQ